MTPGCQFSVLHAFSGGAPTGNLVRNVAGTVFGGTTDGKVFALTP